MTVEQKLTVHLKHIVMPEGVPLNAAQVSELCHKADESQRRAAIDRAHQRIPFLLPDEEHEAEEWAKGSSRPTVLNWESLGGGLYRVHFAHAWADVRLSHGSEGWTAKRINTNSGALSDAQIEAAALETLTGGIT